MLRHIVMMKFKDRNGIEKISATVKMMLDDLVPVVDALKHMEVGININPKPAAYDLVLSADFDDEEGLNSYRAHPDHVKILDFMKEVVDKVTVVDYYL